MAEQWAETKTGYAFGTGGLHGEIRVDERAGELYADLSVESHRTGARLLEPIDVYFRDSDGNDFRPRPRPGTAYREGDSLIVPLFVDTAVGLRLAAGFLPGPEGLDAQFRVQTDLPITAFSVRIGFGQPGGRVDLPFLGAGQPLPTEGQPAEVGAICRLVSEGCPDLLLLADSGEHGTISVDASGRESGSSPGETGPNLTYSLFREPLEKGVLLVGRFGLRPWSGDPDRVALRGIYSRWQATSKFL